MYLAMNHFRIDESQSAAFEQVWRERQSFLAEVPGFASFHLLRGPVEEGARLYASHTMWESQAAFEAWTQSDAFRKAHAQGGQTRTMLLGPPRLALWESVDL